MGCWSESRLFLWYRAQFVSQVGFPLVRRQLQMDANGQGLRRVAADGSVNSVSKPKCRNLPFPWARKLRLEYGKKENRPLLLVVGRPGNRGERPATSGNAHMTDAGSPEQRKRQQDDIWK